MKITVKQLKALIRESVEEVMAAKDPYADRPEWEADELEREAMTIDVARILNKKHGQEAQFVVIGISEIQVKGMGGNIEKSSDPFYINYIIKKSESGDGFFVRNAGKNISKPSNNPEELAAVIDNNISKKRRNKPFEEREWHTIPGDPQPQHMSAEYTEKLRADARGIRSAHKK